MTADSSRRTRVETMAAGIGLGVAGVHLYWGIPRFTAQASIGSFTDPRPLAFVLSGHAIVLAITLALLGVIKPHRLYLPGIALMVIHLVGFAAWHTVLSHGIADPTATGHSPTHGATRTVVSTILWNLSIVLKDVVNSRLAFLAKGLELLGVLLLGYLYLGIDRDPR